MSTLSVKHSFAGGDLIVLLVGLRHVYKETNKKWIVYQRIDFEGFYYEGAIHSTLDSQGNGVTMNRKHFEMLKPLIESQEYIEEFKEWKGEKVDIDIDKSRDSRAIPIPYSPLHYWAFFIAPELSCDLSEKWLDVPRTEIDWIESKILINRTQRYNNPYIDYFFLKQYEKDLVFIGTKTEGELFKTQYNLQIPIVEADNFLDVAKLIDKCRFFLGNQSLCWHIADASKKSRILEICAQFPNTFPTGRDGYAFVNQQSLELLFDKLANKY
jgi:CYTH domain-containing protein